MQISLKPPEKIRIHNKFLQGTWEAAGELPPWLLCQPE